MARGRPLDVEHELVDVFRQNGLVNEYLIKILPPRLWRMNPPGGRGRSIAAFVAHIQSVRRVFGVGNLCRASDKREERMNSSLQYQIHMLHF